MIRIGFIAVFVRIVVLVRVVSGLLGADPVAVRAVHLRGAVAGIRTQRRGARAGVPARWQLLSAAGGDGFPGGLRPT